MIGSDVRRWLRRCISGTLSNDGDSGVEGSELGEDPSCADDFGGDDDWCVTPNGLGCVKRDDESSDSEAAVTSTTADPGFDAVIPTREPVSWVIVSAECSVGESVIVLDPEEMDCVSSASEGRLRVSKEEEDPRTETEGEEAVISESMADSGPSMMGEEASVGDDGTADLSSSTVAPPFCFLTASALRA